MNYYIFYVGGDKAREYLGGTNYVGVWEDTQTKAIDKAKRYFAEGTPIIHVEKNQVQGQIGYVY